MSLPVSRSAQHLRGGGAQYKIGGTLVPSNFFPALCAGICTSDLESASAPIGAIAVESTSRWRHLVTTNVKF